jgi:hypothetical protein
VALTRLEQGTAFPLVGRLEQKAERRLEPIGNFMLVRLERKARWNNAKHGRHDIAGDRSVGLDCPDNVDRGAIEQNLFMRFAERRSDCILPGIEPASGEGDLSGVCSEMLAADGQDDTGLCPIGDRNQDRRLDVGGSAKLGQVTHEGTLDRRSGERVA